MLKHSVFPKQHRERFFGNIQLQKKLTAIPISIVVRQFITGFTSKIPHNITHFQDFASIKRPIFYHYLPEISSFIHDTEQEAFSELKSSAPIF
jgi:hypothetical protein